jgi:phosphoserine phosphatase RsbU/P
MPIRLTNTPLRFLVRRSVRYLLVSHGFRLLQAVVILGALSFVLTGSRIAAIDRLGNRADIVISVLITVIVIWLLTSINRRVMRAIDRRFFREPYDARLILTEMDEALPHLSKTGQLLELAAKKISEALHPENVTVFLDDEDARAYVAAFSIDAANKSVTEPLRNLVLHKDQGPLKQLRKPQGLSYVDVNEADLLPSRAKVDGDLFSVDDNSETLRAVTSALLIPIAVNDRLLGLISLGPRLSNLRYTPEDKHLLLDIANQIARFLENVRMITHVAMDQRSAHDLELAAEVQRRLFPADGLEDRSFEIYGTSLPALGVGGDYYDYFEMGDRRIGIAIADVAGKGIAAALLMSTVQASLRCQLISKERPLADVVSSMNKLLRRSTGDAGYVTFFLAEFDEVTKRLTYVNAGHNPPMLVRRDHTTPRSAISLLPTGGPIIGTFLNEPYEQETIQLQPGDTLVMYTDGVTEALNSTDMEFGEERLRSVLTESVELSAHQEAQKIIDLVKDWQGQALQHDDLTLIVMRVK